MLIHLVPSPLLMCLGVYMWLIVGEMTGIQALKPQVLGGFRRLMRLRKRVFAGDAFAIHMSRLKLREEFAKNKEVTDRFELGKTSLWRYVEKGPHLAPTVTEGLIRGIQEVEEMLSINIVQGRLNNRGNYDVKLHAVDLEPSGGHEMITHVDDRLVGKTVVVERTKANPSIEKANDIK